MRYGFVRLAEVPDSPNYSFLNEELYWWDLEPNEPAAGFDGSVEISDGDVLAKLQSEDLSILFLIWVSYTDMFGGRIETRACLFYDFNDWQFHRYGGDIYNIIRYVGPYEGEQAYTPEPSTTSAPAPAPPSEDSNQK